MQMLLSLSILATFAAPFLAAETVEVSGTWSGTWTPQGGVRDAVTVQLRQESDGNLTGKFLTPIRVDFKKASFNPKTGTLTLEAIDESSGKHYKLDGKLQGTEFKGTL